MGTVIARLRDEHEDPQVRSQCAQLLAVLPSSKSSLSALRQFLLHGPEDAAAQTLRSLPASGSCSTSLLIEVVNSGPPRAAVRAILILSTRDEDRSSVLRVFRRRLAQPAQNERQLDVLFEILDVLPHMLPEARSLLPSVKALLDNPSTPPKLSQRAMHAYRSLAHPGIYYSGR